MLSSLNTFLKRSSLSSTSLLPKKMKISRILSYSSALALRALSTSSSVEAFQIVTFPITTQSSAVVRRRVVAVPGVASLHSTPLLDSSSRSSTYSYGYSSTTTRTFFSSRNDHNNHNDENKKNSIKDKIKKFIPSFLKPKSMLTKREQTKQETKQNISSSIDTVLKDAPLGIRMMGKMISPILSSVAGNLAEAMEEQSRQMEDMLNDARMYIVSDRDAVNALGEPVEVGSPFSQSSSSMNVNGRTSSRINASFEVRGSRSGGVATMDATDGKLSRLILNVNGRNINIGLTTSASVSGTTSSGSRSSSKSSSGIGKNRGFSEDDIIDAEFVEKKVNK